MICTTLVLLAALVALLYAFLVWHFDYWQKRGVKRAKAYPFVGSFPSQFNQRRNVAYDVDDYYKKYKATDNFVGVINCRLPQLMMLDPEYVHKMFVNDFRSFHDNEFSKFTDKNVDAILANNPFFLTGAEWKERRAEVTPGFTGTRINAVYPVTQQVTQKFVEYIRKQAKMATSDGLNAKDLSLNYTTEVVSDCVLGISARSFTENPTPIAKMTAQVFNQSFRFILFTTLANLWPQIRKFYAVGLFNKETEKFFYDIMGSAIELRRKTQNKDRVDFLNYMLQLQDKRGLTNDDLTSHTMTFLTDGFETTAAVLSHALLLLARHPETATRLRAEIGDAPLGFEELSELPYLDACVHETLRLFPALLIARKICTSPFELVNKDGSRLTLQPNEVVMVPVWSLHHDAKFYEDPEAFKPERLLDDGLRKYREMGVYFGFGDGPRICPGMRFALTQVKAAIVEIVRAFDIKTNPRTRSDNRLDDTNFMSALAGGIWLDFEERK